MVQLPPAVCSQTREWTGGTGPGTEREAAGAGRVRDVSKKFRKISSINLGIKFLQCIPFLAVHQTEDAEPEEELLVIGNW